MSLKSFNFNGVRLNNWFTVVHEVFINFWQNEGQKDFVLGNSVLFSTSRPKTLTKSLWLFLLVCCLFAGFKYLVVWAKKTTQTIKLLIIKRPHVYPITLIFILILMPVPYSLFQRFYTRLWQVLRVFYFFIVSINHLTFSRHLTLFLHRFQKNLKISFLKSLMWFLLEIPLAL